MKMRRPGKEMVDAVTGLNGAGRGIGRDRGSGIGVGVVRIKKEPVDEEEEDGVERWKNLPPALEPPSRPVLGGGGTSSPLTQKSGAEDLPSSPPASKPSKPAISVSSSAATISALTAAGRKRRESANQLPISTRTQPTGELRPDESDIDTAAKKLQELDLYEFKESSSPLASSDSGRRPASSGKAGVGAGSTSGSGRAKSLRRHSSVVKDLKAVADSRAFEADPIVPGAGQADSQGRREKAASRRKSMLL